MASATSPSLGRGTTTFGTLGVDHQALISSKLIFPSLSWSMLSRRR